MMENKDDKFEYSYKALSDKEIKRVEAIKTEYDDQSSLRKLEELDKRVKSFPIIISLTFGILGTLVFGLGLTCILKWSNYTFGILLALCGSLILGIAYPLYNYFYNKNKAKYKDEIVRISNELLNEEK